MILIVTKDKAIVHSDKFVVNSPTAEKAELLKDFTDMQRIATGNGTFRLDLTVTDVNNSGAEAFKASQDFIVDYPTDRISISDIELIESYGPATTASRFAKHGLDMVPYTSNYFPPEVTSIRFFAEVYRAASVFGKDSAFILRYRLDGYESRKPAGNLGGYLKEKAKDVNVILNEISIEGLSSGNFVLVVEAVNRQNAVLASKKLMIQHVSKVIVPLAKEELAEIPYEGSFAELLPADSLKQFIKYLYPIASAGEQNTADNLVNGNDEPAMRRHFFHFWLSRDRLDPEGAWKEYKSRVDAVNERYSTLNRTGYESVRGRVYLQYGPPNTIDDQQDDPTNFPFQIWHYYSLGTQRNKRFVFMNKNRATNDYDLIHSDATGEINNPNWIETLSGHQNNFGLGTEDPARSPDNPSGLFGDKRLDTYKRPK